MKLLIVGYDKLGTEYGGGQVYIQDLVAGLIKLRHDVSHLFTTTGDVSFPQLIKLTHSDINELHLVTPKEWRTVFDLQPQSSIIQEIASILLDISPDIIHAHGLKDYVCAAAKLAGIPCVITAHHGGIVCPAGTLLNHSDEICTVPAGQKTCLPCCVKSIPGGKLWLPLLRLIPHDVQVRLGRWLRAWRFFYFVTPLGTLALSIREKLASIEIIGRYTSRLIAPSPAIRDALVRNGIPESKVFVVPHGIPLPQHQPLRANLEKGPIRFLYVGRISHVKGVHVMLESFTGLPPKAYELHIVGSAVTNPERRYQAKLRRQYASINVIWQGSCPHDEVPQHIAACDVMVHPAICLEVFGLTIAEALAVGRPVIASRCGGAETQIREGENGLLVPPNDAIALRQAIQSLIDNPALVRSLAMQQVNVVSIERHIRELEKIYIETVDEAASNMSVN